MFHSQGFRRNNRRASSWNCQNIEPLEVRTLPAGNITVSVVGGVLQITGDDHPNIVGVRQIPQTFTGPWPGASFEIQTGLDVAERVFKVRSDSGTSINGDRDQTSIEVSGVTNGVSINLRGGDDRLFAGRFDGAAKPLANLPGTVNIDAGAGDDDLRLFVVNFTEATFSGGYGDDSILLGGRFRNLTVQTGYRGITNPENSGGHVQLLSLTTNGPFEVYGSPADDRVDFFGDSEINGRFTARFGDGTNGLFVSSENRDGEQLGLPEFRGPVFLAGGAGSDSFRLGDGGFNLRNNALVYGIVRADFGAGDDVFSAQAADGATVELIVDMGEGNDSAFLIYNYGGLPNGTFSGQITAGPGDRDFITRPDEYGDAMVTLFDGVRYIEGLDSFFF